MKKLLSVLFVLFCIANSTAQTFIASPDLDGVTTITNTTTGSYTKWELEYGPTGFTPGTGTVETNITATTKKLALNPFISYDMRIRLGNVVGYGSWSAIFTFSNCAGNTTPLPYTYNFDGNAIQDCWRGYNNPPNNSNITIESQSTYYYGSSGSSVRLLNLNTAGSALLVSPKFTGLATDKMVTFMVRGYTGSILKVGTLSDPYDSTTFHELQTVPVQSTAGDWYKIYTTLSSYNGTDQYIALKFDYVSGQAGNVYIDNFACLPACNKITTLNVSNIGEHTAQLNFTAPGQDTWQVSVSTATSSTQQYNTNSNPFTIPGLTQNTPYQVKIRAVCGANNESEWSEVLNFTTICTPLAPGYFTSFEGDYSLDPCWTRQTSSESNISMQTALYNGTLPILLPKSGSKLLWMRNTFSPFQQPMYLISPYADNINNTKRVSFYLASNSNDLEKNSSSLIIGTVASPDDMASFEPIKEISPQEMNEINDLNTPGDYWKEHIVYLNNYTNTNSHHYLALKHTSAVPSNTFLIDDFTYEDIPACTEPVDLKMNERWWDHVTVSWVNNYSASASAEWQIEYGPAGFAPGTGTIINVTSNPATINNLLDDTEYQFYVRSKCGSNYSGWSDKGIFRTRCSGVSVGYTHDFEQDAYLSLNTCWEGIMPDSNYAGYTENTSLSTLDASIANTGWAAHSGTKLLRVVNKLSPYDPASQQKGIVITPRLLDFNSQKKISFWMNMGPNANGAAPPSETVIIGTMSDPDDYTTFTPFYTITDAMDYIDQWKKYTINFSTYTGTDQYVAIKQGVGNAEHRIFFDDFAYNNLDCEVPSLLTAQQTGNNQITFGWDNGNNANPPVEWQIEYGVPGYEEGAGTTVTVTSNPAVINGLSQYTKYEYHVRNKCGSTYGDWSQRLGFRVSCTLTAPFYESFDQYNFGTGSNFPDEFCWTDNSYFGPQLRQQCLSEVNSCPNSYEIGFTATDINNTSAPVILVSPYLPDFNATKKIKFYARDMNQLGNTIIIGTVTNPMDLTTFEAYTTVSLEGNTTSGKQYEVSFENYTGSAHHFAFKFNAQNLETGLVFIDDIYYINNSSCPEPLNAWPHNVTSDSALIKWDAQSEAQSFEIEYGQFGFEQGTGTTITANTNEKTITGLTAATQYQYYIRSVCSETENSIWAGPQPFTTTCTELSLPWIENLNNMTEYGDGKLPECFKVISSQAPVSFDTPQGTPAFDTDHLMTGAGDTSFLYALANSTSLITPSFSLNAGTSYTFSVMARKAYEYDDSILQLKVGKGNTYQAMETNLYTASVLHEYQYTDLHYTFTPVVSGKYSFNTIWESAYAILLDKFQLQEGYNTTINSNDAEYDFENSLSDDLILENTQNTLIGVVNEGNSNAVEMQGGANDDTWQQEGISGSGNKTIPFSTPQEDNMWPLNQDFITKVNMKVDAGAMQNLSLSFDLKQTYSTANTNSRFRVVINGTPIPNDILPLSASQDAYMSHEYDLTPYVGSTIYISLQHLGKSNDGVGDTAYLDNIKLTGLALNTEDFEFTEFKVFPNPVKNIVTLKNTTNISSVEVYNISGQQLLSQKFDDLSVQLDFAGFSSGVYFIKAACGDKQKVFRIVKD